MAIKKKNQVEFNGPALFPRQFDLIDAATQHRYTLAYGTARGGKSFAYAAFIVTRALRYKRSDHLVLRLTGNSVKTTIWKTFENVLESFGLRLLVAKNLTEMTMTFPNGSTIVFSGVQDEERIAKILGAEYQTIFLNEATEIDYATYEVVASRLNGNAFDDGGNRCKLKLLFDCNPTTKSHWLYQMFVRHVVPGEDRALSNADRYGAIQFDRDSNPSVDADYYDSFADKSFASQLRFLEGEWAEDNPHALFDLARIGRRRVDPDDLDEIIIAVDPATSSHDKSDMTGIIVVGRDESGHYFVLEDLTMKAKPEVWAQAAINLFHKYDADCIVAEKNQGGDMVETVISRTTIGGENVIVRLVHASRGKRVRAEPVAVLYEKNLVNHVAVFRELEQQMIEFDAPGFKGSPDRVDALVWGLTYLSQSNGYVPARFNSFKPHGLWGAA